MSFLGEYIRHPFTIGAVAPSSRFLAKKMVQDIDFEACDCIVEYGPGTGVFTRELLRRKNKKTPLLLIEQNEKFCRDLKKRYGKYRTVSVCRGSAEDVEKFVAKLGKPQNCCVVSGLPFASLPKPVTDAILKATKRVIGREGKFVTFQYTLFKKHVFTKYFEIAGCRYELRNLPPAFVLTMKNPAGRRSRERS